MTFVSPSCSKAASGLLLTTCLTTLLLGCTGKSAPEATQPSPSPSPVQTAAPQSQAAKKSETTQRVEAKLQELMSQDLPAKIQSVSCPDGIEIAAGKTYTCQTTTEAGQFTVKIAIQDPSGKFELQTEGLLLLTKVEELFEKSIKEKSQLTVNADCGSKVRMFQKVGEEFQCQLTTPDGKQLPGRVKVTDMEGGVDVSWNLKP